MAIKTTGPLHAGQAASHRHMGPPPDSLQLTRIRGGSIQSIITYLAACAMAALALSCSRQQGAYAETDGITLDADVPGTKVFLNEKLLGTVPLALSASA